MYKGPVTRNVEFEELAFLCGISEKEWLEGGGLLEVWGLE